MIKIPVSAEDFGMHKHFQKNSEEYGSESSGIGYDAVDLNGAYVPFEKKSPDNLEESEYWNKKRFGLCNPEDYSEEEDY